MNYCLKILKAFNSTLKLGGENTLVYLASSDISDWVEEHELTLSENAAIFDRDLPTKIAYKVGDAFNNYFKMAKYGVPDERWLDFDQMKMKLAGNEPFIQLPQSVKRLLEPKRKPDRGGGGGGGLPRDEPEEKKRWKVNEHKNQPRQLKCSQDMHTKVINNLLHNMKNLSISAPEHEGKQECLRYCYLGNCNSNCERKDNHTPVKQGTDRFKNLVKFRKEALDLYNKDKKSGNEDFS